VNTPQPQQGVFVHNAFVYEKIPPVKSEAPAIVIESTSAVAFLPTHLVLRKIFAAHRQRLGGKPRSDF
jgi:hypothetical protein